MTVVTLEQFETERNRATDLVMTARRFTQTHYELVLACVEFADGPIWVADGAPSAAHWLADRTDHCANTLREWIRIGRALRALRATAEAFKTGNLSFSKVRALTRFATPNNETELLELAAKVPASDIGTALAAWSIRNDNDDVIEARQKRQRHVTTRTDPDGTICGSFRLPPLAGAKLITALNTTMMRTPANRGADGFWPTVTQQRADALGEVIETGGGRYLYEIVIHVTGADTQPHDRNDSSKPATPPASNVDAATCSTTTTSQPTRSPATHSPHNSNSAAPPATPNATTSNRKRSTAPFACFETVERAPNCRTRLSVAAKYPAPSLGLMRSGRYRLDIEILRSRYVRVSFAGRRSQCRIAGWGAEILGVSLSRRWMSGRGIRQRQGGCRSARRSVTALPSGRLGTAV